MKGSNFIRNFFGILLIGIFALSNTPTKYLHALFANHIDFVSKTLTDSNKPQINAPGIDCHCTSNVVIAPFTMQSCPLIKAPLRSLFIYDITDLQNDPSSPVFSFGLRGPPSLS